MFLIFFNVHAITNKASNDFINLILVDVWIDMNLYRYTHNLTKWVYSFSYCYW